MQKYWYDANGNQTKRITSTGTYTLTYNAENQMTGVSGGTTAAFIYDGDGNRVKSTVSITKTVYIGSYFEWSGSTGTMKKYYYAGATRVAMRMGTGTGMIGLSLLLGDQLGSTSITTNSSGVRTGELLYKPWGENRYTYGVTPTSFRFTGQREDSNINLYWYGSRFYDPLLGRFISPDSIIPDPSNSADYDRYSYVHNNPVNLIDPSGHSACWDENANDPECKNYKPTGNGLVTITDSPDKHDSKSDHNTFPYQPDYRTFDIYFGQFGGLIELLMAQAIPGEKGILLAPLAGQLLSAGVGITIDKFGHVYISPGLSAGRTLVSYPLAGMPSINYSYGYIDRGSPYLPEGKATEEELNNLLNGLGRNHGFCGPAIPCIGKTYSLSNSTKAWEFGVGVPQLNIITISFGIKIW